MKWLDILRQPWVRDKIITGGFLGLVVGGLLSNELGAFVSDDIKLLLVLVTAFIGCILGAAWGASGSKAVTGPADRQGTC
jgi:short subunit fatty acids transporter